MNEPLIESTILLPPLASTTKKAALKEVLDALVDAGRLVPGAQKSVHRQLVKREEQGSTGLGNGVAVPHVKATDVDKIVLALGISKPGIPYEAIDGRPVNILFLVLGRKGAPPEEHLQVLRWVSGFARNADFRRFVVNVDTTEALHELLREMSTD